MARFQLYRNTGSRRAEAPFLVDVQNDYLGALTTRIVIPLVAANTLKQKPPGDLFPTIEVDGKDYVLFTPELAALPLTLLRTTVGSVSEADRHCIQEALDRVFGSY
jgi:toxin CcdB